MQTYTSKSKGRELALWAVGFAIVPAGLGYVVARWIPALWRHSPMIWGLLFLGTFFAIGTHFRNRQYGLPGLLVGIMPSLFWLGVFAYWFLVDRASGQPPGLFLMGGQLYAMLVIASATEIMTLLGVRSIALQWAMVVAYGLIVVTFAAGFLRPHLGLRSSGTRRR